MRAHNGSLGCAHREERPPTYDDVGAIYTTNVESTGQLNAARNNELDGKMDQGQLHTLRRFRDYYTGPPATHLARTRGEVRRLEQRLKVSSARLRTERYVGTANERLLLGRKAAWGEKDATTRSYGRHTRLDDLT